MADNTTIGQPGVGSGGDTIRTIQRPDGTKREAVVLDLGGPSANPENLVNAGQNIAANSISVVNASDQGSDPNLATIANILSLGFFGQQQPGIFSAFQELAQNINGIISAGVPVYPFVGGSRGSLTSNPFVTPVVSTSAYVAGNSVGALQPFPIGGSNSGELVSISVACKSVQSFTWTVYVFDRNPFNTAWADHAAPAINVADTQNVIGVYTLAQAASGLGTHTIWTIDGIGKRFLAPILYMIFTTGGTPTFGANDLIYKIGVQLDPY